MAYLNSINTNSTDYAINSFANLLLASGGVTDAKTVTFPNGYDVTDGSNMTFRVLFPYGHNGQANMTLNGVKVVVNKYGTLIPLPYHNISSTYKSLQANTVLEMYYTSNYDGNNTPAFVIVGNPIVLSSNNYIIYADGKNVTDTIYPVGSLYWSSKSTNPSSLFGGTWVQIKDRFVLACGDTYKTVGATGGASSVTLSVSNMPSHYHSFTPSGTVSSHYHGLNGHTHSFTPSGSISSSGQHYHYFEFRDDSASWSTTKSGTNVNAYHSSGSQYVNYNSTDIQKSAGAVIYYPNVSSIDRGLGVCLDTEGNGRASPVNQYLTNGFQSSTSWSGYHNHTFTGSDGTTDGAWGNTESVSPTFTGDAGTTDPRGSGTAFSIMPPYVVKYCWERTA